MFTKSTMAQLNIKMTIDGDCEWRGDVGAAQMYLVKQQQKRESSTSDRGESGRATWKVGKTAGKYEHGGAAERRVAGVVLEKEEGQVRRGQRAGGVGQGGQVQRSEGGGRLRQGGSKQKKKVQERERQDRRQEEARGCAAASQKTRCACVCVLNIFAAQSKVHLLSSVLGSK